MLSYVDKSTRNILIKVQILRFQSGSSFLRNSPSNTINYTHHFNFVSLFFSTLYQCFSSESDKLNVLLLSL